MHKGILVVSNMPAPDTQYQFKCIFVIVQSPLTCEIIKTDIHEVTGQVELDLPTLIISTEFVLLCL